MFWFCSSKLETGSSVNPVWKINAVGDFNVYSKKCLLGSSDTMTKGCKTETFLLFNSLFSQADYPTHISSCLGDHEYTLDHILTSTIPLFSNIACLSSLSLVWPVSYSLRPIAISRCTYKRCDSANWGRFCAFAVCYPGKLVAFVLYIYVSFWLTESVLQDVHLHILHFSKSDKPPSSKGVTIITAVPLI